jgi:hypothetical protein
MWDEAQYLQEVLMNTESGKSARKWFVGELEIRALGLSSYWFVLQSMIMTNEWDLDVAALILSHFFLTTSDARRYYTQEIYLLQPSQLKQHKARRIALMPRHHEPNGEV